MTRTRSILLTAAAAALLSACGPAADAEGPAPAPVAAPQPDAAVVDGRFQACGVAFDLPDTWAPTQDGTHWLLVEDVDETGEFGAVLECLAAAPADVQAALRAKTQQLPDEVAPPEPQSLRGAADVYEGIRRSYRIDGQEHWLDAYYLPTAQAGALLVISSSDGDRRRAHRDALRALADSLGTDASP